MSASLSVQMENLKKSMHSRDARRNQGRLERAVRQLIQRSLKSLFASSTSFLVLSVLYLAILPLLKCACYVLMCCQKRGCPEKRVLEPWSQLAHSLYLCADAGWPGEWG